MAYRIIKGAAVNSDQPDHQHRAHESFSAEFEDQSWTKSDSKFSKFTEEHFSILQNVPEKDFDRVRFWLNWWEREIHFESNKLPDVHDWIS
jgi:hypothetical protein